MKSHKSKLSDTCKLTHRILTTKGNLCVMSYELHFKSLTDYYSSNEIYNTFNFTLLFALVPRAVHNAKEK